ncbi:CRISPR-associated helicase Cas3' [Haloimpatiens lingqiaonensis]|uniref:CRISPR-associated helicase Cas3' n=1 Tax=Haloimpatiens lingqiaonensis TaxID=1380675 RepID=UPI0010FEF2CB|nr:CRISPR-associated helicase Cas3' [Haloimpatiens lingqiaonensis]
MYSFKLYSHENIYLKDHLRKVGDRCEEVLLKKDIKFSYSKEQLLYVAKVMGYTHDFGKGTEFFQTYLEDMLKSGKSEVNQELRSHSYLSSLITYYQLRDFDEKLAFIAHTIVKRHHGNLENIDIECTHDEVDLKKYKKNIKNQLEGLCLDELNIIMKELSLKEISNEGILELIDCVEDYSEEYLDMLESTENEYEEYVLYKILFSTLIYADKEDAIFHKTKDISYDVPYDIVDKYKLQKYGRPKKELDAVRNEIYNDVINNIENYSSKIMSITVPTGTGKTLTSFSAALHLKEKLNKDMKIIYCLPFTSIIDQNYDVYKGIIEEIMGKDKSTNERLLKHHYLTEKKYVSEEEYYKINESKFLVENWNSQIVVTTFMQVFNTIFSSYNKECVKYNNIANSIILLDEVQSIPHKYWRVINSLFKEMAEKLNVYFILITATQPLIFGKDEIKELVPNNEKYFEKFKRTKLIVEPEKIQFNSFLARIEEMILHNCDKNILIILNTVRNAQNTYNFIKDMEIEDAEMYFLSTGIVPVVRKKRIDSIKERNGKRKIVVSTQLIEAGVDIDMDIVVRELAPLDSINQSAGRANREYREEYLGNVYIFDIVNHKDVSFSTYIYDGLLIDKTKEVLNKYYNEEYIIYEEKYQNLNKDYFSLVNENMSGADSKKLIGYIENLNFKDIKEGKNAFRLIEASDKVSVFIELDNKAKDTYRQWQDIRNEKDPSKRMELFEGIKGDFYSYVITVYKNKVRENKDENIVYIPMAELSSSYDEETGYVLGDKDVIL